MTENNTGQSRSSQHRQPKKKASSPSNKKKILKKVLIGLGAFIGVALIAIIAIFAYYNHKLLIMNIQFWVDCL